MIARCNALIANFALVTLVAATGCQLIPGYAQRMEPDFPIVDAHVHPDFPGGREPTSGIESTREEFWREMKEAHVMAAVALEQPNGNFAADLKPPQIFKCVGLGDNPNYRNVEEKLRTTGYHCLKIYLGYTHKFANDKSFQPAYALALKYQVPVIFHTGDTDSAQAEVKYSDPLTIDEVAVEHPKVTFVIAHLGNPWYQSAAEVAFKNPNVVVDLSGMMIGKLKDRAKIDRYLVEPIRWAWDYVENPEKFIYGSDWPVTDMATYLEAVKRAIPREHWCDVFYRNAVRVYHLAEASGHSCPPTALH